MPVYRLVLEYDGTFFAGWQMQPGGRRTVQGELARGLERVTGAFAVPVAAGRTDAGVHAEGQVASVRLETRLPDAVLLRALDAVLPPDLAVRDLGRAPDGFHALRDARTKLYRYAIWNGPTRSPLRAGRSLRVAGRLDPEAMARAARHLEGTHDFASFCAAGSGARTTVRTLRRVAVQTGPAGEIGVEIVGDGFLRHMVRIAVGTLLEVGRGRRDPEELPAVLAARDRRAAGPTAPPHGLTLVRVDYDAGAGEPAGGGPS